MRQGHIKAGPRPKDDEKLESSLIETSVDIEDNDFKVVNVRNYENLIWKVFILLPILILAARGSFPNYDIAPFTWAALIIIGGAHLVIIAVTLAKRRRLKPSKSPQTQIFGTATD